ncbi:peptidase M1 [Arachidicoccus ginsenosidimutans]|uniref:M1 family metallopeptidase n=1 Tax=Arachidicoccus sp. BS20 TaxID=1850526 RepID=UPI0007F13663|nr:M1 family metallopeptidase [Arachidicoccus sp. BS20]ANI89157.1 peptidase M1 [Arachidicoccus sp. BS20]
MKKLFLPLCLLSFVFVKAQSGSDTTWKHEYRASATKINDVVNTKLAVKFDYDKSYMYGKAWITLQPHFYPTDSLTLDAKGMDIKEIAMLNGTKKTPLKYTYNDSLQLHIQLGKTFKGGEKYTVYIDYVSKPDERKTHGSAAITDDKGLYFINPKGLVKDKPIQIWTQGETESNSVWFPTIDKPDQKSTEEIAMTVPAKYVTLSNGLLVSQKKNSDGTRTDTWKQDLPIAPYLFFMGVGDYAIVKDSYEGKPVEYYVEHEYESVARRIFGHTPEMIGFYSKILGIDYPWAKYDQIVGRDYVSGAMENVTATLHQESAQQNARQLTDGNVWEDDIAHELFHHWFGDLVTCESWSNITVNESFANYSEYLWENYKYGKDAGDAENYEQMQEYLNSANSRNKNLVRYYYKDKEDVFDLVSYQKGGRILHMLRHIIGDSAFFKSLNLYLNQNKFGTGSATKLRLAFEQITGEDWNWYWNQWYFGAGNPVLDITYAYDSAAKTSTVTIEQTQKNEQIFKLPIDIDIYHGKNKIRHSVWMTQQKQSYTFNVGDKPDLINVDGDKILLAEKNDHKTLKEFINQYNLAGNYVDREEAVAYAINHLDEDGAKDFLVNTALNDKFHGIRKDVLQAVNPTVYSAADFEKIAGIAKNDPYRLVRAAAIDALTFSRDSAYKPIYLAGVYDSSYSVAGSSLQALATLDKDKAVSMAAELQKDARGRLASVVQRLTISTKSDADFDNLYDSYTSLPLGQEKVTQTFDMITYLGNLHDTEHFKRLTDAIIETRDKVVPYVPQYKDAVNKRLETILSNKKTQLNNAANKDDEQAQINYLQSRL